MHRIGWERCIVAATGPSLTKHVAEQCRGHKVIAVNDAHQLLPFADVLYACDAKWWEMKAPLFLGEKWTCHHAEHNDQTKVARLFGLKVIAADYGVGFSFDPDKIHFGDNSGFQAVNLAIAFGARHIVLVGFDMQRVGGKSHFFGEHPPGFCAQDFALFARNFEDAAARMPAWLRIVNATPSSALKCFQLMDLESALDEFSKVPA